MGTNWKAYHPSYESDIKSLVTESALLHLLKKELSDLESKGEKEKTSIKALQLDHKIIMLERSVQHLKSHIEMLKSFFESREPPYDNYHQDLKTNTNKLNKRFSEYKEIFKDRKLIKTGSDGSELPPARWHMDTKTDISPVQPTVTKTLRTYRKPKKSNDSTKFSTDIAQYFPARFKYADSEEFIRNRFILFWEYDEENANKIGRGTYDIRFIMRPIGFGITDDAGFIRQCHDLPDTSKIWISTKCNEKPYIKVNYYSDALRKDIFETKENLYSFDPKRSLKLYNDWEKNESITNIKMKDSEYAKYGKTTNGAFKSSLTIGFMVYPLDQGPFKTLDLNKMAEIDAPDYPGADKLIFKGKVDSHSKEIKLHCPLPEWNNRLEEALAELELNINAFNSVAAPHQQKLKVIERFHSLTNIHLKHTHEKIDAEEEVAKVNLLQELEKLHDGISARLIHPTEDRPIFFQFAYLKKDIDRSAFNLWNILKSPALKAELENYLKHTKDKKVSDDGEYPAGPYMEYEPGWGKIFETISKCYASLSSSEVVAKQVWEQHIQEGIDILALSKKNTDDADIISKLWQAQSGKNEYLRFKYDLEKIASENLGTPEPKGLFGSILHNYSTAVKPVLDQVVRLPGPPCTLQVILSCYDSFINQYIHRKVLSRQDQVFHIKVFIGITRTFMIGTTNVEFRKVVFASFSIKTTNDKYFENAKKGKKELALFFRQAGNDNSQSNNRFYGKFKDPVAASAKTVFWAFNMCIMIQGIRAVSADQTKSDSRKAVEYANASFQAIGAMGSGYALASRLTTSLLNKQAFKGAQLALNIADKAAVITGLISGALALNDAIKYSEQGETDKALVEYIRATGSIALSVGYILRTKVAKKAITSIGKLIGREIAAAGAGATSGGFLLVVGTVINIGLFIKDLADIITSIEGIFDKTTTEMAKILWITFQADTNLTFNSKHFGTDKKFITSLQGIYDKTPYKTYTDKGMQYGYEHLTIEPIKQVDILYYDSLTDFDGGVTWRELSWRAVIPLHLMHYKTEQIEKVVEMPDFDDDNDHKIRTVKDIINYYESVVKHSARGSKDTAVEIDENGQKVKYNIADLLESGESFPPRNQEFYQHEKWDHKLFDVKPHESNLINMPEFKDYVSQ